MVIPFMVQCILFLVTQMNTEMNWKLKLVICIGIYVSERDMLWSISRVVILNWIRIQFFLNTYAIPKQVI